MPGQAIRSTLGNTPPAAPPATPKPVPLNGHYPKFLQGKKSGTGRGDGSVWLVSAPKTGTIVFASARPQKAKHKVGYYSTRLREEDMVPYNGAITLNASSGF